MRLKRVLTVVAVLPLALMLPPRASGAAASPAPAFSLRASSQPTALLSSVSEQQYEIVLTNIGGSASAGTVTVTDTLPTGVTTLVQARGGDPEVGEWSCTPAAGLTVLTCTFPEPVAAFSQTPAINIPVTVAEGPETTGVDVAHASGGGAPAVSTNSESPINAPPPAFGVAGLAEYLTAPDGTPDSTAAGHPYALTVTADLNTVVRTTPEGHVEPTSVRDVKDVIFDLPPGLLASATATPTCTFAQLASFASCPRDTRVGHLFTLPRAGTSVNSALYNMVPERGVPAEFGFIDALKSTHAVYASIAPTPAGYVLRVTVRELPQIALTDLVVTIYGDPAAANESPESPRALLTNPSHCSGVGLATTVHLDSWQAPGVLLNNGTPAGEAKLESPGWVSAGGRPAPPVTGCNELRFQPSIFTAQPDTAAADSPTGLSLDLQTPQTVSPLNLATPPLRDIHLTLPAGLTIDPSAARGLQACTEDEVGWLGRTLTDFNAAAPACPEASTIGSVEAQTRLIAGVLHGSLYLATQNQNPLGALLGVYVVIDDSTTGVLVKIAGELSTDPLTGQITAEFDELPQLPLSDLKLRLSGGPRGLLATPQSCATFTTATDLKPWSAPESGPDTTPSDSFQIASGCPASFTPSLSAGTVSNQAGSYSPFVLTLSREDSDQHLAGLALDAPPGVLANLSAVPPCPSLQASTGSCPASSQIGEANVTAGVGPNPYPITAGRVYLTGPYNNGPFGLSIVIPAQAGPFDLGNIVIRASIRIDPSSGELSIVTDPLPQMLDSVEGLRSGIPADLRTIALRLDRPGFTFNPTSCEPMSVTATLTSAEGATSTPASHFQAAGCASLAFTPSVTAATAARPSQATGASLNIAISYPRAAQGSQAWLGEARFELPRQLPARLSTLQHACPAAVFRANPAGCPAASVIGHAVVHTPVLPAALAGPLYLVSNGGASFPEAVTLLQGDGVMIELRGQTQIGSRTGVTSIAFRELPDVPLESIEVSLPEGRYSEFGANVPAKAKGSFCGQNLVIPTLLRAQNGRELRRSVKITVTGCRSRKQNLTAALNNCHKRHGRQRTACERAARRAYGARSPKTANAPRGARG